MKSYDIGTTETNRRIKLCKNDAIALLCELCFLCE
jgi:hypothetical protein